MKFIGPKDSLITNNLWSKKETSPCLNKIKKYEIKVQCRRLSTLIISGKSNVRACMISCQGLFTYLKEMGNPRHRRLPNAL